MINQTRYFPPYLIMDGNLVSTKNVFILIFGVFVIILTIGFNLFIILTVLFNKTMQNYTNIQFAFMSSADLLVGCIAMPSLLITALYEYWPLGQNMCALWAVGDFVGGNLSIITLTIVSLHRLRCIKKPSVSKKSTFESLIPSLIAWPLVILFWTIPILVINQKNLNFTNYDSSDCFFIYSFEYVLVVDLVAYVLPVALLVYFQVSIYVSLKNKKKLIHSKRNNSVSNTNTTTIGISQSSPINPTERRSILNE